MNDHIENKWVVSDYDRTKESDNNYLQKHNNWVSLDYDNTKETSKHQDEENNEGIGKVLVQRLVDFSDNVSMHGIGLISRKNTHIIVR